MNNQKYFRVGDTVRIANISGKAKVGTIVSELYTKEGHLAYIVNVAGVEYKVFRQSLVTYPDWPNFCFKYIE